MTPLCLPSPATVREGQDGEPAAVLLEGKWQQVSGIEDLWSFDLWWMPEPLARTYHRVETEDGGEVTLFLDQQSGRWFRQNS